MWFKSKKILLISIFLISLLLLPPAIEYASGETVKIDPTKAISVTGGEITGTLSSDKSIAIYKGIPYAAPPVGELRWKAPQPIVPWDGIKKCTSFGANAMQKDAKPASCWTQEFVVDTSTGYSEDCLYLNVWTKAGEVAEKRPVIVYIHGGSFNSGGGSCEVYDGEEIAKKDAVYVNINYRVGIFGFLVDPKLSAESPDKVSGNYGIMDMIQALEWVKANISQFGGDPDNVTIVGQSAGAAGVDILAVSPKAKGLFKNAFSMSYSSTITYMNTLKERENAQAKAFKSMTLKEMRDIPAAKLVNYSNKNWPCIDGVYITDNPISAYYNGTANDVNMISGLVLRDSDFYGVVDTTTMTKKQFEQMVNKNFGSYATDILKLYPVKGDNAMSSFNALRTDVMMASENGLGYVRSLYSDKPTYVYLFSHVMPGEIEYGAFHSSDIPYWLNHFTSLRKDYWKPLDYDIGDMMSSYLVNFAKTGDPNGPGLPKWAPYKNGAVSYHSIGDTTSDKTLSKKKSDFWKNYFGIPTSIN